MLEKGIVVAPDFTFDGHKLSFGHLYLEAGFTKEYVQSLMTHSTENMTAHYSDRHESQWKQCDLVLKI